MREGMRRSAHRRFLLVSATAWMLILLAAFCLRTSVACAAPGMPAVISAENDTWENGSSNTTSEPVTEKPSKTNTSESGEDREKDIEKKKHLAAEQYALGVILAGSITIGILIVMYFYWSKRANTRDR